jgi:tRNA pseudouridine55 synthase
MFSAKKQGGKKLYELARKGCVVEREPCRVTVKTEIISYKYPYLEWRVDCSKGTYIRSMAYDLGIKLGCFAHVKELRRTRSGPFLVSDARSLEQLLQLNSEEFSSLLLRPERV